MCVCVCEMHAHAFALHSCIAHLEVTMIAITQTQQALLQNVKVFHPALAKNTTMAILGDEKRTQQPVMVQE